jgi:methyl-accepting chemotaxis protein
MTRKLGIILFGAMLVVSLNTAFARSEEDSPGSIDETISEILNAINDIIKGSLALAEAELKQLQRQLEKRGGALQEEAEQSILRALQKALSELKELDRAIKRNLEDMKRRQKERLNDYRKTADTIEKRVAEIKKQLEEFAQKMEKESATVRGPVEKKVRQILAEMERALDRTEQRFKKHKEIEDTLSAELEPKFYSSSWNRNVTVKT